MSWQAYQIILRLHSPLHIGWGRVSYLQRIHPYVTGRVLRGALVSRVARNQPELISDDPLDPYRRVSKTLAAYLAFTYFYPALEKGNEQWEAYFPWENETVFRLRFLSSYVSTALAYPDQTAAEGLLYETEFISPYTLDDGKPVYLMGYIFVDEAHLKRESYDWAGVLCRLQLGGERGYGWGDVRLEKIGRISNETPLFDRDIRLDLQQKRPTVHLEAGQRVLAHTNAQAGNLAGHVEPIIGREWRADNEEKKRSQNVSVGQHLPFNGVQFVPGSIVTQKSVFSIGEAGYWQ